MIIPGGYGQLNILFEGSNLPNSAEVTLGFKNIGTREIDECLDDAEQAILDCSFNTVMPSGQSIRGIRIKLGPNQTGPMGEKSFVVNGSASGGASPPNVSYLVRKQTAVGGRMARGRLYWPGVPEGSVGNDGLIDPTALSNLQGKMLSLRTNLGGAGMPLFLLHATQFSSDVPPPYEIVALNVDNRAATQRRRLRR